MEPLRQVEVRTGAYSYTRIYSQSSIQSPSTTTAATDTTIFCIVYCYVMPVSKDYAG
jgi:hypothetical protein